MKTKIIIALLGLLLIGTIIAGGLTNTSKDIIITKERLTALTSITGTQIKPEVSSIKCNVNQCWARIYQEDLIDDTWMITKTNQTSKQLEDLRDAYVKKKLEKLADEILNPIVHTSTKQVEGGVLTFKDK